jgi:hypothetical protein
VLGQQVELTWVNCHHCGDLYPWLPGNQFFA